MRETIQSPQESLPITNIFVDGENVTETSSSQVRCEIYSFGDYVDIKPEIPERYTAIGDLVSEWEKDDTRRAELEDARRWVADTFHGEDGDTVRTLRMRKGWSQTRLAKELSTSQSHVARIERGTENITIDTCRRLMRVLDVDMNTINLALIHQETIAQKKVSQ